MATWSEISARMGRNDLPHAVIMGVVEGRLTDPDEIAKGVEAAWVGAEWPLKAAEPDVWMLAWGAAVTDFGERYLEDGTIRPTSDLPEYLSVWRGCHEAGRYGMSWTSDRATATWFASRFGDPDLHLYELEVPREAVLGRFNGRNEHEVVIDPEWLMLDDVEPEQIG
jgi:hypothetical protein